MAKGILTLRDVPADLRSRRAERARQQVREHLEHPALTDPQRERLHAQLAWIAQWERGDVLLPEEPLLLPQAPPPPPALPPAGRSHNVDLAEELSIQTEG